MMKREVQIESEIEAGASSATTNVSEEQASLSEANVQSVNRDLKTTEDDERELYSADSYTDYLVDSSGTSYEPYQLAWRYLGMYTSCGGSGGSRRELSWYSSATNYFNSGRSCERRVMWAAYVNPYYRGYEIGEYSFYDFSSYDYTENYCKTSSCMPLDCHEAETHWSFIGTFYEASGFEDFAEQLFKHQGVCVWSNDNVYNTMQSTRELLPYSCTQLSLKLNSKTLYMDLKPLPDGEITIGLYTDQYCSTEAKASWSDYVSRYNSVYKSSSYSQYASDNTEDSLVKYGDLNTLNSYMNNFKTCQPCRSYNLNGYQYSSGQEDSHSHDDHDHSDEGGGYYERSGYDCNDDAGYLNCNQCYKFQTKTEMYKADSSELALANSQGTILEIEVDGTTYGYGGYGRNSSYTATTAYSSSSASSGYSGGRYSGGSSYSSSGRSSSGSSGYYGVSAFAVGVAMAYVFRKRLGTIATKCQSCRQNNTLPDSFRETLADEITDDGSIIQLPVLS